MTTTFMPINYQIDAERGMLFIVAEGEIGQPERMAAMKAWLTDPEFRPGMNTLADFTGATNVPTLQELEEIVDHIRRNVAVIGQKKIAIVTARPVIFGVARQFGALAPGAVTVQVFRDRDAALAWLSESQP